MRIIESASPSASDVHSEFYNRNLSLAFFIKRSENASRLRSFCVYPVYCGTLDVF